MAKADVNDPTKTAAPNAAAGRIGGAGLDASFPHADQTGGGNSPLQANAAAQGAGGAPEAKEMTQPCLMEMGDVGPALAVLLKMQAEYARGEPGTSRAMRDVAYNAVAAEIERYVNSRLRATPPDLHAMNAAYLDRNAGATNERFRRP